MIAYCRVWNAYKCNVKFDNVIYSILFLNYFYSIYAAYFKYTYLFITCKHHVHMSNFRNKKKKKYFVYPTLAGSFEYNK